MSWRSKFSPFKNQNEILQAIRENATPIHRTGFPQNSSSSYDKLLDAVGDAKVVMIGEASHGTYDFYKERAEITKRLIMEKGFNCISVEADWPDAYKINRYVRGEGGQDPASAVSEFKRFPRWMWRNEVMLEFVEWLRNYNSQQAESKKVDFYGLDLYSMFESAYEVIQHLNKVDPSQAKIARERYNCFAMHGSTQRYGLATVRLHKSCEPGVTKQLMDMVNRYNRFVDSGGNRALGMHEEFYAKMNAKVVKDAEEYYRKMFAEDTWNIRDTHMVETLKEILKHKEQAYKVPGKSVVWAHNSHLGDATQTDAVLRDEINVGSLTRQHFKLENTFNIGFSTYTGTVTASSDWDGPPKTMTVRPSLAESNELLLHDTGIKEFYLLFRSNSPTATVNQDIYLEFQKKRPERFIGVIYRPDTERLSHYYDCRLSSQFDCMIHLDQTRAIKPMDKESELFADEEETYPSGL